MPGKREIASLPRMLVQFAPAPAAMRKPKIHHAAGEQSAA